MKVLVDAKLLNYETQINKGLLHGLIKLQQSGCSIFIDAKQNIQPDIRKLLEIEGVEIRKIELTDTTFDCVLKSHSQSIVVQLNNDKKELTAMNLEDAFSIIRKNQRTASVERNTKETQIKIKAKLDDPFTSEISTGIGFFDHMLDQIAKHSNIGLKIFVKGDLHVDEHHTVEDVGITLGQAIKEALGTKKGIKRYGFLLPMDESIAKCAIDLGGRTFLNFKCKFNREKVGEFPTELTEEFFRGLASGLGANIFIRCKGVNDHHKIENIFKAFAKSLNEACRFDDRVGDQLPSTKGVL